MKSGFDINKLSNDGYLILPLSMSRLASGHGQDPEQVYEMIRHFLQKLETYSNDVILLYTQGLYFNSHGVAYEERKKLNQQILNHSRSLRNLIDKRKLFIPNSFHYLPCEYVMLNSSHFSPFFERLKKAEKEDEHFRLALTKDMKGREYNEASLNFLFEEIAIAHILRQHLVELPRTLVRNDVWRLIVYPGSPIYGDCYQWKKKILPQKDKINLYSGGQYDYNKKAFFQFDKMLLPHEENLNLLVAGN